MQFRLMINWFQPIHVYMQVEISWNNRNTLEDCKWFNWQCFKAMIYNYNQALNTTSSQWQNAFISSKLGFLAFNRCSFRRSCCLFCRRLLCFGIFNFLASHTSFLERSVIDFLNVFNFRVDKFIDHGCDWSEELFHSLQKFTDFFFWVIFKSYQVFLNSNWCFHHRQFKLSKIFNHGI